MTGIDLGILAVLFLPAILGLLCGLLNVLFSIAAWVMATLVAIKFSGWFSSLLSAYLEPLLRDVVAFAGVFIVGLIIFTALGHVVCKLLDRTGLTAVNRLLGCCFGFGLGGVAITVLVFLAGFTALSKNEWWHEAVLLEPFQRVCVWGRGFLPEDIAAYHHYEAAPDDHAHGGGDRWQPVPGGPEPAAFPPAGRG